MVSGAGRRAIVVAGVLAAGGAGAAVIAQAGSAPRSLAAETGGLAASSLKIERQAAAGATNTVEVANRSNRALTVTVTARPWTQSSSGAVSPNRRARLGPVNVSADSFTLAPNASRKVDVVLRGVPSGGSLYGALEVVGLPADLAKRKGVVTGYRLVGAIRYHAALKTYALKAGTAKVARDKMIVLPIRSTGNTNELVSGTVRVKGPLGTRQGSVRAMRILPGKQVSVGLVSAKGLQAGSYTATITLKQGSLRTNITKKLRIKR